MVVAKGARRLNSSRLGALEPGNLVKIQLHHTHHWPILTQAQVQSDCRQIRSGLVKLRQLSQLMEIVDRLFVEEELSPAIFELILSIRAKILLSQPTKKTVINQFNQLFQQLGYPSVREAGHDNVTGYVASLSDRPMKSWEYLVVNDPSG